MLEHLRGLREDADKSQKEMAEWLHVHQTTYSGYELGTCNIPVASLLKLARLFGTSTDYLLGLTDEKAPYPRSKT